MRTVIAGGTILTPDRVLQHCTLIVDGARISEITNQAVPQQPGDLRIDLNGQNVVPGFIDVHVHGSQGADTMDAIPDAIHSMGRYVARHGVTAFCPTTMAASADDILAAIRNFAALIESPDSAHPLGLHLEGPYLSSRFRGAQPARFLRAADAREYRPWLQNKDVRLITVAPEIEGVSELIRRGVESGVEFAVGHSNATYEQMLAAVDLGLRQATHTFNGMPGLHHREPGLLTAVLDDERVRAQIIADGIHVHPAMIRLLIKMKGTDHTILITDATRAAGMPNGEYTLGSNQIHVDGGIARNSEGSLAGSTLTLDQALRNVMSYADLSLAQALPMATQTPAAALGLSRRKGFIRPGFDADIAILDQANHVQLTIVEGRVVYDGRLGGQS
jgi:N-acetylglucosamine-6-phosphate deacetylase